MGEAMADGVTKGEATPEPCGHSTTHAQRAAVCSQPAMKQHLEEAINDRVAMSGQRLVSIAGVVARDFAGAILTGSTPSS